MAWNGSFASFRNREGSGDGTSSMDPNSLGRSGWRCSESRISIDFEKESPTAAVSTTFYMGCCNAGNVRWGLGGTRRQFDREQLRTQCFAMGRLTPNRAPLIGVCDKY